MSDGHLVEESEIVDAVAIPGERGLRECVTTVKRHFAEDDIALSNFVSFYANGPDDAGRGSIDFVRQSAEKATGQTERNKKKSFFHQQQWLPDWRCEPSGETSRYRISFPRPGCKRGTDV